jgi:hypothetical protein
LRDAKSESEFSKANNCFICSVDRETFKRKGVDFNGHTKSDHNLWHYLYFFAYLKEQKMKGDLTPIELYVMNKVEFVFMCFNVKRLREESLPSFSRLKELMRLNLKRLKEI